MINTTQEIITSIKKGKMVIIMDDENRENEGDLVMAAEFVTAKDVNFMASKGRGLICLTLTSSKCKKLGLPLIKKTGETSKETNFTVKSLKRCAMIFTQKNRYLHLLMFLIYLDFLP